MSDAVPDSLAVQLASFIDPQLGVSWGSLGVTPRFVAATRAELEQAGADATSSTVEVALGYPVGAVGGFAAELAAAVRAHCAAPQLPLRFTFAVPPGRGFGEVAHLIAVASGKGGVGKSTTAVNLALALAAAGARVGLLDADIYGPSQGLLLGIAPDRKPEVRDEKTFVPVPAHGLVTMSMSYLSSDRTPVVWRGPMASGALQQLLKQTLWGALDYLLIDMPPGTGDIQLTLSQQAPVSGAVIVTTPQDLALLDARKGIEMFRKVEIPTLGIIENMSVHVCEQCGHESHPFGTGGGARIAAQYQVPVLGELPLSLAIRTQTDAGRPVVVTDPEGDAGVRYAQAARALAARLWALEADRGSASINIRMSDD